jgi:hypothetical protein
MEDTDSDSKKSAKKTARKSCEKTSFLKDLSHIWAAWLVLVMHASHDLNIDFRNICWVGSSNEESKCKGDGLCGSGLGGVNCELSNSIGNSDTLIDYDRLDQGTDRRKILHSGNLAKGTHGSFDADDPGWSCNRKRKRRIEEDDTEPHAK